MHRDILILMIGCCLLGACTKEKPRISNIPLPITNLSANVDFESFLDMGMQEQDVFVAAMPSSPTVTRFDAADSRTPEERAHIFKGAVYASKNPVPHDFYGTGKNSIGPFEKGDRMGVSLVRWVSANGKGTYKAENGIASLKASFSNLLANSNYSLWCLRVSKNKTVESPCTKPKQAGNPVHTDARGNAKIEATFQALPDSSTETGSWLALVYHRDKREGVEAPLEFGKVMHVQVLTRIPSPAELKPAY
jgi:hypothetical protein